MNSLCCYLSSWLLLNTVAIFTQGSLEGELTTNKRSYQLTIFITDLWTARLH